jgi:hypothetical protein
VLCAFLDVGNWVAVGEEVAVEYLIDCLHSLGWVWIQHFKHELHKALRNFVVAEQIACVRVKLVKIEVVWTVLEEREKPIGHFCGIERWNTECKHVKQDT